MQKSILFICTHNSARSQLAEGLVNHFFSDTWTAYSAGTEQTVVKPLAIEAMAKIGIDISHQTSKTFERFLDQTIDFVVTVCDDAKEKCPFFPGAGKRIHMSFKDPSNTEGDHQTRLEAFIKTRDEIKMWLDQTLPTL